LYSFANINTVCIKKKTKLHSKTDHNFAKYTLISKNSFTVSVLKSMCTFIIWHQFWYYDTCKSWKFI